jgi:sugar phosphate isomerase/epimerase
MRAQIYLGSVLLESNRWTRERLPTFRVSEWTDRSAAAGFDGIELWENHCALADPAERAALQAAHLPVTIYNSYVMLRADGEPARRQAAAFVRELKAPAVKFNVGADPETLESELRTAREWAAGMPGVRLLCECHPGTALEDAATAAAALAGYPEIGVIVHPCNRADLPDWLRHLGPKIRHAHVQMVTAQRRRWRLCDQPTLARERLAMLRDGGFTGSLTIEFTAGVGVAPESREALFAAACADLAFLRENGFGGDSA